MPLGRINRLSRAAGGTGRRARLRGVWGNPSGFESRVAHHAFRTANRSRGTAQGPDDAVAALDPHLCERKAEMARPCARSLGYGNCRRIQWLPPSSVDQIALASPIHRADLLSWNARKPASGALIANTSGSLIEVDHVAPPLAEARSR